MVAAGCRGGFCKTWLRDRLKDAGIGKKEGGTVTYVAFTSSFAGTGGIVEAMVDVFVACSGALFEGDFFRLKSPMFVVDK